MKPKTLTFKANGDANSYALIDADTGKWVLSLLANGEMHTAEQIALLARVAQCWNTAPEFAGLPKRKLESLLSEDWCVNGVSLQRTQEDGTVKHAACTTGGMVLWWHSEQERVIAPSVRSVMQQALKALEVNDNRLEIDRYPIDGTTRNSGRSAITALREALAAPKQAKKPGFYTDLAGTIPAVDGDAVALVVTQSFDDISASPQPAQQKPVLRLKGIDEYGPMLDWYKHWTDFPVGTKFYTAPQPAQQQAPADVAALICAVVRGVAELEYTGIEGAPAVMQVTADELAAIIMGYFESSEAFSPVPQQDPDTRLAESMSVARQRAQRIAELEKLSVTNIMLAITPGDGSGYEVYAKTVDDVVDKLSELGQELEEWQLGIKRHPAMEKRIEELELQLAARVPLTREQAGALLTEAGYDGAAAISRADFLNGLRHGEAAHAIPPENTPPKAPGAPE